MRGNPPPSPTFFGSLYLISNSTTILCLRKTWPRILCSVAVTGVHQHPSLDDHVGLLDLLHPLGHLLLLIPPLDAPHLHQVGTMADLMELFTTQNIAKGKKMVLEFVYHKKRCRLCVCLRVCFSLFQSFCFCLSRVFFVFPKIFATRCQERCSGEGELLAQAENAFVFVFVFLFVFVFVFSLSRVSVFVFPVIFVTKRVAVERESSLLVQENT